MMLGAGIGGKGKKSHNKALQAFIGLMACIALLGLYGCSDKAARPLDIQARDILRPDNDRLVAIIGTRQIYYHDVYRMAAEKGLIDPSQSEETGQEGKARVNPEKQRIAPLRADIYNEALESVIDQILLAEDARNLNIDKSAEAQYRLARGQDAILSALRLEAYIRDHVTEQAMLDLYDRQAKLADIGDEIHAQHILVKSQKQAKALSKQLEQGAQFDQLASELSLDKDSRDRGGDLGYFTKDSLAKDFTTPIFTAKQPDNLLIFKSNQGWHVTEILDRRPIRGQSYQDSREALHRFLTFSAIDDVLKDLRAKYEITYLPLEQGDKIKSNTKIE